MDELLDILDEAGRPTGEIIAKAEAHRLGLWHHPTEFVPQNEDYLAQVARAACRLLSGESPAPIFSTS